MLHRTSYLKRLHSLVLPSVVSADGSALYDASSELGLSQRKVEDLAADYNLISVSVALNLLGCPFALGHSPLSQYTSILSLVASKNWLLKSASL